MGETKKQETEFDKVLQEANEVYVAQIATADGLRFLFFSHQ